jgi:hypothetical protein
MVRRKDSCAIISDNTTFFKGFHITFASAKDIRVNDEPLTALASSPVRYPTFTIYKAGIFAIINGTHFHLRWDFGEVDTLG